jgi:hypothetical protein
MLGCLIFDRFMLDRFVLASWHQRRQRLYACAKCVDGDIIMLDRTGRQRVLRGREDGVQRSNDFRERRARMRRLDQQLASDVITKSGRNNFGQLF